MSYISNEDDENEVDGFVEDFENAIMMLKKDENVVSITIEGQHDQQI